MVLNLPEKDQVARAQETQSGVAWGKARTSKLEYYFCILAESLESPCIYFTNLPYERQRAGIEARLTRGCGPSTPARRRRNLAYLKSLDAVASCQGKGMTTLLKQHGCCPRPFPNNHSKLLRRKLSNPHLGLHVKKTPTCASITCRIARPCNGIHLASYRKCAYDRAPGCPWWG